MNDTGSPAPREPTLSLEEADHSRRMRERVVAAIGAAGGWLSFEHYMDLVLYAPGLGYYSAGARKLGKDGDFTTAPEISGLFGACVARQCAELLARLPGASILEVGAGSGTLAADLLERLERANQLPQRYRILEISADLRSRQCEYLRWRVPQLLTRIEWLDSPPAESFDGLVVANEVLDALPVSRFCCTGAGVEELGVVHEKGGLRWASRHASAALAQACAQLAAAAGPWDDGYVSEYCPRLRAWTAEVTRSLRAGAVLWFDYGLPRAHYYLPERSEGTLLCHFRHRAHADPFLHPGLQDITAWVDFTALAEAGAAAGFELAGYTTQTYFLAGTGIDREMQEMAGSDANRHARLANEARRLMMPGEMGERFKAMAWMRGVDVELCGFGLRDLRHTL
ncbi:MAG TPA: SAM-dependent methyltransferase [Steroidobacteraceae bacterium]|nr:SAM-dependent methyltransferase [Steroidobacteraceae bacterium]